MRHLGTRLLLVVACAIASFGLLGASASAAPQQGSATSCYPSCAPPGTTVNTAPLISQPPSSTKATTGTATVSTPVSAQGSLAFTGADIAGTVVLALVVLGAGVVLVRVSHRRRSLPRL